jgi:SAM-dependent methyltransferase
MEAGMDSSPGTSEGGELFSYWNHNAEHHPRILAAVPPGCASALDVGCGEGLLVRKLARCVDTVVGVDLSSEMVRLARERSAGSPNTRFVAADFLEKGQVGGTGAAQEIGSGYGFVCAVAVVHHVGFAAAIDAMTAVLAPGGRLMIVGIATDSTPFDRALGALAVRANPVYRRRNGGEGGEAAMPVARPTMSWREVREQSNRLLPGRRYRRHLLWRYSLVWEKP